MNTHMTCIYRYRYRYRFVWFPIHAGSLFRVLLYSISLSPARYRQKAHLPYDWSATYSTSRSTADRLPASLQGPLLLDHAFLHFVAGPFFLTWPWTRTGDHGVSSWRCYHLSQLGTPH